MNLKATFSFHGSKPHTFIAPFVFNKQKISQMQLNKHAESTLPLFPEDRHRINAFFMTHMFSHVWTVNRERSQLNAIRLSSFAVPLLVGVSVKFRTFIFADMRRCKSAKAMIHSSKCMIDASFRRLRVLYILCSFLQCTLV